MDKNSKQYKPPPRLMLRVGGCTRIRCPHRRRFSTTKMHQSVSSWDPRFKTRSKSDNDPKDEGLEPNQEVKNDTPDPNILDIRHDNLTDTRSHLRYETREARRAVVEPRPRNYQTSSLSSRSSSKARKGRPCPSTFEGKIHGEDMADSGECSEIHAIKAYPQSEIRTPP